MKKILTLALCLLSVGLILAAIKEDKTTKTNVPQSSSQSDFFRVWEMDFTKIEGYDENCAYHVEDFQEDLVLVSETEKVEKDYGTALIVRRVMLTNPEGKILFSEDMSEQELSILHGIISDDGITISLLSRVETADKPENKDEEASYNFVNLNIRYENGEYTSQWDIME